MAVAVVEVVAGASIGSVTAAVVFGSDESSESEWSILEAVDEAIGSCETGGKCRLEVCYPGY